ncbi:HPC2-domain-containing protein [Pleomassaria siparia CBS 279.74]|uniref:HPC2-domain-containing protein n=1 Tax=Pleomassaria siparia CBS 279.74 TaxID=1314801 RepID=A0A6G1JQT7_9PLEO|nr:HPC2-domain-containing protein [Pleomassaria siparia CBS 279.74]
MENEVASSPGSLSSPPHSPEQSNNGNKSTIRRSSNNGVAANPSTPTPAAPASTTTTPRLTAAGTIRKKPGPKPKPKDPSLVEEKKTRKSRKLVEPRDPSAAPPPPPPPPPRKRRTKASLDAQPVPQKTPPPASASAPAPTPTPTPAPAPAPSPLSVPSPVQAPIPVQQTRPTEPPPILQTEHPSVVAQPPRVSSNPEPLHHNPNLSHISVTPTPSSPRPASSGQRYDPIRGGLYESKPQAATSSSVPPPPISPPLNRASASPSITSLIDPPSTSNSTYPQAARLQHHVSVTSAPVSPAAMASRPASVLPHHNQTKVTHAAPPTISTAMDIDSDLTSSAIVPMKKSSSASGATPSNSSVPTPTVKPVRQKEAPPPLPTGSGLLSGTPFGPAANGTGPIDPQGVNIWLTFPLKGQTNITINFAQEVEKKYGLAALNPRVAARRERQRQITAAGAALEKAAGVGSADDMSLDLSEPESNVEMGGMNDDGSAGGNKVKQKKRKTEDYDKEDDFIDDTELAWEQQALMAKDGFFVYSGPLVTEGEKPAVERADGSVKRGRGRGRGGTVRGEASARGRGRGGGGGGGGGPGSRGGSTVRKPRVTKADRAMMEQEKHEREKMAATMTMKQQAAVPAYSASATVL